MADPVNAVQMIEIGCGENMTLSGYLAKLCQSDNGQFRKPIFTLRVPQALARLSTHIFDSLHITPYSIGHHELLEFDNIPEHNQLTELLRRDPPIGYINNEVEPSNDRSPVTDDKTFVT